MQPLWNDTAPPAPETSPLAGDAACDVAIIGAGILGLSAALTLVRAGIRVIVLEAAQPGAGASGRNGGLVVPALPRIGPETLIAKLGPERGQHLAALVAGSAAETFALIAAETIDCEAQQAGWLQPAHAATLAPRVAARVDQWQRAGAACVWLDTAETRRRMGSERFHGALFDPTGGHLNPLAYTRGFARAVIAAGATLHTETPVLSLARGQAWTLTTARGRVTADTVLQCTNGQPPGLSNVALCHSTVPLFVFQLASPVLDDTVRQTVLTGNEAFSDTRNNLLSCRWTASGRLVTGGMAALQTGAMHRLPGRLAARLHAVFPALAGITLERIWRGQASLTGDFLPRLFEPAPGWLAPVACNGRGIALNTVLGRVIGEAIVTKSLDALPLPRTAPKPLRPHFIARLAPQVLLPLGDWQDRRAERAAL